MATFEPNGVAPDQEHSVSRSTWRRSSRCEHANCVEVSFGQKIVVRDSTFPDASRLTFTMQEWRDFITALRTGLFDRS